jgi:hypothetical protein
LEEYASAFETALDGGRWGEVDDLLGEWQATAEALADPELRRLLEEAPTRGERLPLEYPA